MMSYNNFLFSEVVHLFSWRTPTHRKTAPCWCRIQNPMGVATYKTSNDMSEELKRALPPIEALKKLLDAEDMDEE